MQVEIERLKAEAASTSLIQSQIQVMINQGLIKQDEHGNIVAVEDRAEREQRKQEFESASKQREPSQPRPELSDEELMAEEQIIS